MVDNSVFKTYLSQVGSLYETLQLAKSEDNDGTSQLLRRSSKGDDFVESLERGLLKERGGLSSPVGSRQGSFAGQSPISAVPPSLGRRSSSGLPKRGPQAVNPLSTIPSVYFEEDFRLENPRTFDIVSERSEVVRPPGPNKEANGSAEAGPAFGRKALTTNAILQEKISWYMDTVEVHLISSISTASTSFFAALGELRELQSEASDCVEKIKILREDLARLDKEMAVGGLKIPRIPKEEREPGEAGMCDGATKKSGPCCSTL